MIAEEIGTLKSKTFAVIIDEAHSSQSGESAKNLRASLSQGIELDVTEDDADEVSDIDARIIEEMEQRRMQDHISYFGFSGTPKNKTLYQINLIHIVFRFYKSIETRHVAAQCPSFLRTIDTD